MGDVVVLIGEMGVVVDGLSAYAWTGLRRTRCCDEVEEEMERRLVVGLCKGASSVVILYAGLEGSYVWYIDVGGVGGWMVMTGIKGDVGDIRCVPPRETLVALRPSAEDAVFRGLL